MDNVTASAQVGLVAVTQLLYALDPVFPLRCTLRGMRYELKNQGEESEGRYHFCAYIVGLAPISCVDLELRPDKHLGYRANSGSVRLYKEDSQYNEGEVSEIYTFFQVRFDPGHPNRQVFAAGNGKTAAHHHLFNRMCRPELPNISKTPGGTKGLYTFRYLTWEGLEQYKLISTRTEVQDLIECGLREGCFSAESAESLAQRAKELIRVK